MGSSIDINPSTANIALSPQGSEFLWTWFALFLASALIVAFVGHHRPVGHRPFHFIALAILLITSLAYFLMAANLAWTPVPVEFIRSGTRGAQQIRNGAPIPPTRSIAYGRYVMWALTCPLELLMLCLLTGFPLSRVFITLFMGLFAVVCGLIGALIATRYKFALLTFGVFALFYLWFTLLHSGRRSSFALSNEIGTGFIRPAFLLCTVWVVYPIIWACAEGGNVITVTSECIAYGILDLLTKIVFPFYFLFNIEGIQDWERLGMTSGKASDGLAYTNNTGTPVHPGASGGRPSTATAPGSSPATVPGVAGPGNQQAVRTTPPSAVGGGGGPGAPPAPAVETESGEGGFRRSAL
ncbi:hypothetical protein JCM8547_000046 [Rhodosporidiobolus lusitaniae]